MSGSESIKGIWYFVQSYHCTFILPRECYFILSKLFYSSFQMDADYDENETYDQSIFGGRKRKGRSRFAHVVAQKKPVFDPGLLFILLEVRR